jgi:pimeloyl-ACP methyl ester carboxylesterase
MLGCPVTAATREVQATSPDGTAIEVTLYGRQGPALMIIPGAMNLAEYYAAVASDLARDCTVAVMERRGYRADDPAVYCSLDEEIGDFEAVRDVLDRPAVMGHSSTAVMALCWALEDPPPRLLLYEPPLPTHGPIAAAALDDYRAALEAGDLEGALELGLSRVVRMPEEELAARKADPGWIDAAARAPLWTRDLEAIDQAPTDLADYKRLTMPVGLLIGTETWPWLVDLSKELAAVLPNAALLPLEGEGHLAHLTNPSALAAAMRPFVLA